MATRRIGHDYLAESRARENAITRTKQIAMDEQNRRSAARDAFMVKVVVGLAALGVAWFLLMSALDLVNSIVGWAVGRPLELAVGTAVGIGLGIWITSGRFNQQPWWARLLLLVCAVLFLVLSPVGGTAFVLCVAAAVFSTRIFKQIRKVVRV